MNLKNNFLTLYKVVAVAQWLSLVRLFLTPRTEECQAPLSSTTSQSFLRLMYIKSMILSTHLILCHPLILLPSIFPSIRAFSKESVLHIRWPKYWSFSLSISPSNEYSGLISFRIDCDHLAVQGTLKSLFQQHSSKASTLWHSTQPFYGPTHICIVEKPYLRPYRPLPAK